MKVIGDYGEHKFQLEKRARALKKKGRAAQLKELRLTYSIGQHDYQIKLQSARAFLERGDQVLLRLVLRDDELQNSEQAIELLNHFAGELGDLAIWTEDPRLDGKDVLLLLSPPRDL